MERSELAWSMIDSKPVLLYLEKLDEYVVYWNGVVMTHAMALSLSCELVGIIPTHSMQVAMCYNRDKIHAARGFGQNPRQYINGHTEYKYLRTVMSRHLKRVITDRAVSAAEVLSWFEYSRARTESANKPDQQR